MKTSNMIYVGLGIGALAGTAYLFATDHGKSVRKSLVNRAGKLGNKLAGIVADTENELVNLKEFIRDEMTQLSDDARNRILNILEESNSSAKKVKMHAAKNLAVE